MDTEIIKSFLVGLGFGVDDASLAKFNKAITSATLKVGAMYTAIQVASAGIFKGISGVSQSFEDMGYQLRILAPAMNRWMVMRQAMLTAYAKAGVNLGQVVRQAVLFNYSLAKTKFALEAVYKSVAARFFPLLTKQMDIFRQKIFANMPKIQAQLQKFIEFIFKMFQATTELGSRLWSILGRLADFFITLHKATGGWSTAILGAVAAWKLLNLGFLATPLGMIITGFTALLALWDDFKTFREGGQSLINWGSDFTKTLIGLAFVISTIIALVYAWNIAEKAWVAISSIAATVMGVLDAESIALAAAMAIIEAPVWAVVAAIGALLSILTLVDSKWHIFGGHLSGVFGAIGAGAMNFLGGATGGALGSGNPLLPPGGGGSNQNVSQQTHITVNGAADANQVGKNVINGQDRVNFDMVRNLSTAVQ